MNITLPPEIIHQIFDNADIADSLALGDTCSSIRNAANGWAGNALAPKVKERVPWIRPGNDGFEQSTWFGCARLICARSRRLGKVQRDTCGPLTKKTPCSKTTLEVVMVETVPKAVVTTAGLWFERGNTFGSGSSSVAFKPVKAAVNLETDESQKQLTEKLSQEDKNTLKTLFDIPDGAQDVSFWANDKEVLVHVNPGYAILSHYFFVIGRRQGVLDSSSTYSTSFNGPKWSVTSLTDVFFLHLSDYSDQWHTFYVNRTTKALQLVYGPHSALQEGDMVEYDGLLWFNSVFATLDQWIPQIVDIGVLNKTMKDVRFFNADDPREVEIVRGQDTPHLPWSMFKFGGFGLSYGMVGCLHQRVVNGGRRTAHAGSHRQASGQCRSLIQSSAIPGAVVDLATATEYLPAKVPANSAIFAGISQQARGQHTVGYWGVPLHLVGD